MIGQGMRHLMAPSERYGCLYLLQHAGLLEHAAKLHVEGFWEVGTKRNRDSRLVSASST